MADLTIVRRAEWVTIIRATQRGCFDRGNRVCSGRFLLDKIFNIYRLLYSIAQSILLLSEIAPHKFL